MGSTSIPGSRPGPTEFIDDLGPPPQREAEPRSLVSRLRGGPLAALLLTTAMPTIGCVRALGIDKPGMPVETVFDDTQVDVEDQEAALPTVTFDPGKRWSRRKILRHFRRNGQMGHLSAIVRKIPSTFCAQFSGVAYYGEVDIPVFTVENDCWNKFDESVFHHQIEPGVGAFYDEIFDTIVVSDEGVQGGLDGINHFVQDGKAPMEYDDLLNSIVAHEMDHHFSVSMVEGFDGIGTTERIEEMFEDVPGEAPPIFYFDELRAYAVSLLTMGDYKKEYLKTMVCYIYGGDCPDLSNTASYAVVSIWVGIENKMNAMGYQWQNMHDVHQFIDEHMTEDDIKEIAEGMINQSIEFVRSMEQ